MPKSLVPGRIVPNGEAPGLALSHIWRTADGSRAQIGSRLQRSDRSRGGPSRALASRRSAPRASAACAVPAAGEARRRCRRGPGMMLLAVGRRRIIVRLSPDSSSGSGSSETRAWRRVYRMVARSCGTPHDNPRGSIGARYCRPAARVRQWGISSAASGLPYSNHQSAVTFVPQFLLPPMPRSPLALRSADCHIKRVPSP
jgi:hypothetical protein